MFPGSKLTQKPLKNCHGHIYENSKQFLSKIWEIILTI